MAVKALYALQNGFLGFERTGLFYGERSPERVAIPVTCYLVRTDDAVILFDTGISPRALPGLVRTDPLCRFEDADLLVHRLDSVGIEPKDVDLVVLSHLHFDHAGGNTERGARGEMRAAYPNAEYLVQKGDLEVAGWRNERTRGSYLPHAYEPLLREGRLRTLEGECDLGGGLRVLLAPGHTPWLQLPLVTTPEGSLLFLADLVPTTSHLRYAWIMGRR